MSEQNLSGIARDLIDAFNARNSEQFKKQLTNTVVYDEIGTNRKFQGADAWLQVWEHWRNAFPDLNGTITNAVDPRGTAEKRPMRDTSKPANGTETGQALLYRAEPPFSNPFSLF
jgi:predicted ester cyclase